MTQNNDTREDTTPDTEFQDPMNTPPLEAFFVAEIDVDTDHEDPVFIELYGPFETREKAETERDVYKQAWQQALENSTENSPYDIKDWKIIEKHMWESTINRLERQLADEHQAMMEAASAVTTSLIAEHTDPRNE